MPFERRRRPSIAPSNNDPSPYSPPPAISSTPSYSSSSTDSTSASDSSNLASPFEGLRIHEEQRHLQQQQQQKDHDQYLELDTDTIMLERMHHGSPVSTPDSPSYRTRPLLPHSHTHFLSRPSGERPPLPRRNTSFPKRHASLDSPRETPLPYMPSQVHNPPYSPSSSRVIQPDTEHDPPTPSDALVQGPRPVPADSTPTAAPSTSSAAVEPPIQSQPLSPPPQYMDTTDDAPTPPRLSPTQKRSPERHQHHQHRRNIAGPVQMYGRPMSSPETSSSTPIYSPRPLHPAPSTSTSTESSSRSSTLSLPIPMNTPYHTLPNIQGSATNPQPEGPPAPRPPATSSVPSSASYPQSRPSGSRRAGYMAPAPVPPRATFASSPPDWLREYSEPRRNVSPATPDDGFPQPAPPTVLTPPPPPQSNAAHEPFLSHAPPPQDSYIAVETSPSEYRLIVRLPGYRRDSITLSTRRRRILHVVADSWEPGGGHFERRISFGYDADLVQVRAEFDGELLRIVVPRRMALMTYWGTRS